MPSFVIKAEDGPVDIYTHAEVVAAGISAGDQIRVQNQSPAIILHTCSKAAWTEDEVFNIYPETNETNTSGDSNAWVMVDAGATRLFIDVV